MVRLIILTQSVAEVDLARVLVINVVAFTSNSTDPDVIYPDVTFCCNTTRKCALSLRDYKKISRTLFLFAPTVIHIMQSDMSTTNTVDKGVWSACWSAQGYALDVTTLGYPYPVTNAPAPPL